MESIEKSARICIWYEHFGSSEYSTVSIQSLTTMTGAVRSTPPEVLGMVMKIKDLHKTLKMMAVKALLRVKEAVKEECRLCFPKMMDGWDIIRMPILPSTHRFSLIRNIG